MTPLPRPLNPTVSTGAISTATLSFESSTGFNSVVVHYQSPPPGCDWGPNFMADNMNVTPMPTPPGDLNGDGHIDGADLGILLSAWGTLDLGDLNDSGPMDGSGLVVLLSRWGAASPVLRGTGSERRGTARPVSLSIPGEVGRHSHALPRPDHLCYSPASRGR